MATKRRVSYFYHGDVGLFHYGEGHPMKPHRLRLTHQLLLSYGLYRKMDVYEPPRATMEQMCRFHSDEYIQFLKQISPENFKGLASQMQEFNVGEFTDCPVFPGLFDFCQIYTGASIEAARKVNCGATDIAVNWSGGLHHAKKAEASGFCYVNDIVLAILELLKRHPRVVYIDIDIHHGDGVEEAFYTTDRVMTVSFHKYGDFFPGTGDIRDTGHKQGKHHAVNVPLQDGMDDHSYEFIFKPIMSKVMEMYRPTAIVLQCGADSLTGDRLGCFNLTLKGHASCVEYMKTFNVPMLVLGGGGYTNKNVARCWAYETSVLLDEPISNDIPPNDYYAYYAPDYKLHLTPTDAPNQNDRNHLELITNRVLENLKNVQGAPSVQMYTLPSQEIISETILTEEQNMDMHSRSITKDGAIAREHPAEFYENDADNDARDPEPDAPTASSSSQLAEPGNGEDTTDTSVPMPIGE